MMARFVWHETPDDTASNRSGSLVVDRRAEEFAGGEKGRFG